MKFQFSFTAATLLLSSSVTAFAPISSSKLSAKKSLSAIPEGIQALDSITQITQSSDILLSKVTSENYGEVAKSVIIVLLVGGGLIPAAIVANASMIKTLSGKRAGGDDDRSNYISESGASGPALPGQALLFASEKIPLVDVIAIIGRINGYESIADWRNLPSTKQSANVFWLPRDMFKENMRNAKFLGWPTDPKTGEPIGGAELQKAEKARISKKNPAIGDAALDAVFDSWAWGASIATPDKVEKTLSLFKSGNSFNINEFSSAASRGRAVTGLGAVSFVLIQAIAYGCLFVAPALRVFFDIDVGFGQLGQCDGICNTLF